MLGNDASLQSSEAFSGWWCRTFVGCSVSQWCCGCRWLQKLEWPKYWGWHLGFGLKLKAALKRLCRWLLLQLMILFKYFYVVTSIFDYLIFFFLPFGQLRFRIELPWVFTSDSSFKATQLVLAHFLVISGSVVLISFQVEIPLGNTGVWALVQPCCVVPKDNAEQAALEKIETTVSDFWVVLATFPVQ